MFGQVKVGPTVEVVQDSAIALPPLNQLLACAQMAQTPVWRLLQSYRGKSAVAIDRIAEVLIRVGEIAADHTEIHGTGHSRFAMTRRDGASDTAL